MRHPEAIMEEIENCLNDGKHNYVLDLVAELKEAWGICYDDPEWNKWITPEKFKEIEGVEWIGPVWSGIRFCGKIEWKVDTFEHAYCCPFDLIVIANNHGKPPTNFIPEE